MATEKIQGLFSLLEQAETEGRSIKSDANSSATNKNWFYLEVRQYAFLKLEKDIKLWLKYWMEIGWPERVKKFKQSKGKIYVDDLRKRPIEELYPGELRNIGSRLTGKCPFHNPEGHKEKSASFFIFEDNSFHCFSCQVHGSGAIDFLMQLKNLDFVSAIHELA